MKRKRFKHVFFAVFSILLLSNTIISCDNRIYEIKSTESDSHIITILKSGKFLLLPIEEKAPATEVRVDGGSKYRIKLAQKNIDYYVPININPNGGSTVEIKRLSDSAIALSNFQVNNRFDTSNREKFRPNYHFTPAYGWINDPNGLVYHDGIYHLFYQHNPFGSTWENMSWGHATSKDLNTWEQHPVAIYPDSLGSIYSGSAIVDKKGIAGFGKDAILAFFTYNNYSRNPQQVQGLAYSTDGGGTFVKYKNNPILIDKRFPKDHRDPKVFYHNESQQWIMLLTGGENIVFYKSKNLINWEFTSEFVAPAVNGEKIICECPDLIELSIDGEPRNKKWILFTSRLSGLYGSSSTEYHIGDFDGNKFTIDENSSTKWIDYGKDNYASVSWSGAPQATIIGWFNNWGYSHDIPTQQYRGGMTLARKLSLFRQDGKLYLKTTPISNNEKLGKSQKNISDLNITNEELIDNLSETPSESYKINIDITMQNAKELEFTLYNDKNEELIFSIDKNQKTISINRNNSGLVNFHEKFSTITTAPLLKTDNMLVEIFVDNSTLEVFINNGETAITNLIYPSAPYNQIKLHTTKGNCKINKLQYFTY